MAETTLVGNTTADVELRYTQGGKPVGSVTVAVTDRKFDRATNEWVDGSTWFARCTIWGEMAEHAAGSIPKGTRVVAVGRIVQRDWEDKDGNKRTSVEVTVDEIGPSLRYATAQVVKSGAGAHGNGGRGDVNPPFGGGEGFDGSTPQSADSGNTSSGGGWDADVPF